MRRHLSLLDRLVAECDEALKTISVKSHVSSSIKNPAHGLPEPELSADERRHSEGLLRVDHTGEVCAQALYRGQALCATDASSREFFLNAAQEESNHLVWTRERLQELQGRPSYFNPFWYAASFSMGVAVSFCGDPLSLGFVMETEKQVLAHLDAHLKDLPEQDERSRAILLQMREDEAHHADAAEKEGGKDLPWPVKILMKLHSKVMTTSAYYW